MIVSENGAHFSGSCANKTAAARTRRRFCYWVHDSRQMTLWQIMRRQNPILLHRALVVEAVLVVLDDGRHRLQRQLAFGILDHVLQVEILDRDVVVAIFERAAD